MMHACISLRKDMKQKLMTIDRSSKQKLDVLMTAPGRAGLPPAIC
jgi:hypothetical protein